MFKFIEAALILSGMIIGVGMFGIPFSFAESGFLLGALELAVLTGVMLVFHLAFGEIAVKTREPHSLPGYIAIHLGRNVSYLAWVAMLFGTVGTLLVYILIGSRFLSQVFLSASYRTDEFSLAVAISALGAAILFFSLKREALVNGVLTALLIGFIVFLVMTLLPRISVENLLGFYPENVFLPYGVLLFALSGGVAIPGMVSLLEGDRRRVRAAVIAGTLIPAILYFFFAAAVVGVSGVFTSEEAIAGLSNFVGEGVVLVGSLMGFLAVLTSLIVLGAYFRDALTFDLGIPRTISWLLASSVPFFFYLLGFQDFITVIGVVGAVAVGVESALLLAAYHAVQRREGRLSWFSYIWEYAIYAMVVAGVTHVIAQTFV